MSFFAGALSRREGAREDLGRLVGEMLGRAAGTGLEGAVTWSDSVSCWATVGGLLIPTDAGAGCGVFEGELCTPSSRSEHEAAVWLANTIATSPDQLADASGAFAIVHWDGAQRVLRFARDPFGRQELFLCQVDDALCLSSEISALLRLRHLSAVPDPETILEFLTYDYRSHVRTFFGKIRQAPPGCWGEVSLGRPGERVHRYFEAAAATRPEPRDPDWAEGRLLFNSAVRRSVAAAGPTVVVHLSGGLDSAAVVTVADRLARREGGPDLVAASARYEGLSCDEGSRIESVLASTGRRGISWSGLRALWTSPVRDGVESPGSLYPWVGGSDGDLATAKSVGAQVILSGVGGDEAGAWTDALLDLAARGSWLSLGVEIGLFSHDPERQRRLARSVGRNILASVRRRSSQPTSVSLPPVWLGDLTREAWKTRGVEARLDQDAAVLKTHLQRQIWNLCTRPTRTFLLSFERQAAARRGIRYRYPFLDTSFVRWCVRSATRPRRPGGFPKPLHRRLFADVLPPSHLLGRAENEFSSAIEAEVRMAGTFLRELFHDRRWEAAAFVVQKDFRELTERLLISPPGRLRRKGAATTLDWWRVREVAKLEVWLRSVLQFRGLC